MNTCLMKNYKNKIFVIFSLFSNLISEQNKLISNNLLKLDIKIIILSIKKIHPDKNKM